MLWRDAGGSPKVRHFGTAAFTPLLLDETTAAICRRSQFVNAKSDSLDVRVLFPVCSAGTRHVTDLPCLPTTPFGASSAHYAEIGFGEQKRSGEIRRVSP